MPGRELLGSPEAVPGLFSLLCSSAAASSTRVSRAWDLLQCLSTGAFTGSPIPRRSSSTDSMKELKEKEEKTQKRKEYRKERKSLL